MHRYVTQIHASKMATHEFLTYLDRDGMRLHITHLMDKKEKNSKQRVWMRSNGCMRVLMFKCLESVRDMREVRYRFQRSA